MRSSRLWSLCLALTLSLSTVCRADAIDDYMNSHLAKTRTPGAAIAVVQGGVLTRAQGYGYANLEHHVPVHADTIFQSGSLGKMFTAVTVMLLVEDGKLRLDESIRTYLPDSPASWAPITLRHLLTHTSGLDRNPDIDLRKDYTDEEFFQILYRVKQQFPAGERLSYSNSGYVLLGLLVKKVGGQSFPEVLKARVFGPLGMNTARLIDDRGIVPNRSAGYQMSEDGKTILNQDWVAPTGNSTGDGALYLTVLDWAKWEAGVHARKILKPESWAQVFTPVRLNSGKTYPYGFGWFLDNYDGHEAQYHSGSWQGFVTLYVRYLREDTAVIALTNARFGEPDQIVRNVARLVDPRLAPPVGAPIADRDPAVTRRVKAILVENTFPAAEAASFASADARKRLTEGYQEHRAGLGKLGELRLFGYEERGDDRMYTYRARFASGIANIAVTLSPSNTILRFQVRPAESWDAPIT